MPANIGGSRAVLDAAIEAEIEVYDERADDAGCDREVRGSAGHGTQQV
jgi:hypothetical protein